MSNINITLNIPKHPDLRLRSIHHPDIENLRRWKNANKQSFFLAEDITAEQQEKWYSVFSQRVHDHMFIVEQETADGWKSIGCMGFRRLEDESCVDGYNIIRAERIEPASFTMSDAFLAMLAYAAHQYPALPLQVKVLSHNPATSWYEKNGFHVIEQRDDHVLMELDTSVLQHIEWTIKSTT
jgi:hypothetical protein